MDDVLTKVHKHRDVLLSAEDHSGLSQAIAGLRDMGPLREEVLAETFVGLAVDVLSKDAKVSESVRSSSRELLQMWQDSLHRGPSTEMPRERSRSPEHIAAVPGLTKQRVKVVEKLFEALSAAKARETNMGRPPLLVAAETEDALFHQLEGRKYASQARSLLYNIKDESNEFAGRLLDGNLKISQLPSLTAEDMASAKKNARRAQVRQEAFEAAAVRPASHSISDRYVCEKCGGNKTAYTQNAAVESCVRSGGEPVETMVTFVTCLGCSNTWTERSGFA